jgi:hypothetical protein
MMPHATHKEVGQHRDANGLLTAILVPTDLVLAQTPARCNLTATLADHGLLSQRFMGA